MRRWLVAAAILASATLLAGCTAPGPEPTAPSPTPTETTTPLTQLAAGDCYDPSGTGLVLVLDCTDSHTYEVFASLLLEDTDYPADTIAATASARCRTAFAAFVGLEYDASELALRTVAPSETTWERGDREVLCVISDPDRRSTGSLERALR